MPVKVKQIFGKFRVVEVKSQKIAKTDSGKPRDGGGHATREKAVAQVVAINNPEEKK